MEEEKSPIDNLFGDVNKYVNTRIDLITLKVAEKSAEAASGVVTGVILLVIFLFFILFGSFALAIGLSQLLDSGYAGFLIVAGIYLLTGILLAMNKDKWLAEPIQDMVVKQFFKARKE
jgi:hypothetical protein